MTTPDSDIDLVVVPSQVLSMTDEEGDIVVFHSYLRTLPADSLWDILAHIDSEKYPLRVQAAHREIARRRLFFVSPYTVFEGRLRLVFGFAVGLSAFAAGLHAIGSVYVPLDPGEHLTWFYDLAIGGPPAARMVLPLACLLAELGAVATLLGSFAAVWYLVRRKLRADVLGMGFVSLLAICLFLRIASASQP